MVTSLGALVTWKKQEDNAKQAGGVKAPLRVSGCKKVALNTQINSNAFVRLDFEH